MKKQLTAEQKAKSDARKEKFAQIVAQVAAMSPEEKAAMAARMGVVVNCEGHALSVRNTMLIAMQRPSATIVGGFRQWIEKGRVVRKGEHGASILFPCQPKKDDGAQEGETNTKGERVFFKSGTVFDIGQTEEINASEKEAA